MHALTTENDALQKRLAVVSSSLANGGARPKPYHELCSRHVLAVHNLQLCHQQRCMTQTLSSTLAQSLASSCTSVNVSSPLAHGGACHEPCRNPCPNPSRGCASRARSKRMTAYTKVSPHFLLHACMHLQPLGCVAFLVLVVVSLSPGCTRFQTLSWLPLYGKGLRLRRVNPQEPAH